jgi:hypothetical protein
MHQAEPTIPIADVWPLPKLTEPVQAAYNALAKKGEIYVVKVTVSKSSRMAVIEYLSTLPIEWTHEAIKRQLTEAMP